MVPQGDYGWASTGFDEADADPGTLSAVFSNAKKNVKSAVDTTRSIKDVHKTIRSALGPGGIITAASTFKPGRLSGTDSGRWTDGGNHRRRCILGRLREGQSFSMAGTAAPGSVLCTRRHRDQRRAQHCLRGRTGDPHPPVAVRLPRSTHTIAGGKRGGGRSATVTQGTGRTRSLFQPGQSAPEWITDAP